MSWKEELKGCIQNVESIKKKVNVRVVCKDNKSGKAAKKIIGENINSLSGGYEMKKISSGLTSKDFTLKFKVSTGAENFRKNILAIMNDKSITAKDPVDQDEALDPDRIAAMAGTGDSGENSSNTTIFVIVGSVLLLLAVIGIVIWKKK